MKAIDEILEILEKGNHIKDKKTKIDTMNNLENGTILYTDIYDSTPEIISRTEEKSVGDNYAITKIDFLDKDHILVKTQTIVSEFLEEFNTTIDKFIFTSEYEVENNIVKNSTMYLSKSYVNGYIIATKDNNPIYGKHGKFTYQFIDKNVLYSIYKVSNIKADNFSIYLEKVKGETHTLITIENKNNYYTMTLNVYDDNSYRTYILAENLKDSTQILLSNKEFLSIFFGDDMDMWHYTGKDDNMYNNFESIFKNLEREFKNKPVSMETEKRKISIVDDSNCGYEIIIEQSNVEIQNRVIISSINIEEDKSIVNKSEYIGVSHNDMADIRSIILL